MKVLTLPVLLAFAAGVLLSASVKGLVGKAKSKAGV
jgi:zinc transporter ZupT